MALNFIIDGMTAHAANGGLVNSSSDPAVVLIHGAGLDRTIWQMQTRNIAFRGRRVFALDLPGHGFSAGTALATIEEMADWVARFTAAADISSATVMGHSMGSLVALEFAYRYPDQVDLLILTGVAESMPVHPELLAAAKANDPLAPELIVYWGLGEKAQAGGHPLPGFWVHGATEVLLKNAKSGVLACDLAACEMYGDAKKRAAKISCPTHFVLGRDDKMSPVQSGKRLAGVIDKAEVHILERCGHMMMVERPNEMHHALRPVIF